MQARPIISALLKGRVIITPLSDKRWTLRGEGTLAGLFETGVFPVGLASPAGFDEVCTVKTTGIIEIPSRAA